jgi:hypothetical protein
VKPSHSSERPPHIGAVAPAARPNPTDQDPRHLGWKRAVVVAAAAGLAALVAVSAGATPAASTPTYNSPMIPPTNNSPSPFRTDPGSSLATGLVPNQTVTPLMAPQQPVVLTWNGVPGAESYLVQVSATPGFSKIVWSKQTDQQQIAPDSVLADGTYWWRVTAIDGAGTHGITSSVATFAKKWVGSVSGGVLSNSPGGPASSVVSLAPYLRWNAVPGAAYYQVQIAPGSQFASPVFDSGLITQTGVAPGDAGVLPDGNYVWRVRAFDAGHNPGPWATESSYSKTWGAPTTTAPADGATVGNFELNWNPVAGADSYEVQVTKEQFTFTGTPLVVNTPTASDAYVPTLAETQSQGLGAGQYWWRVRPVIHGITGSWSPVDTFTLGAPSASAAPPTLSSDTTASTTALTPVLSWTPVTGAQIYRVDIATDTNFNNIVESQLTTSTAWAVRSPLPDNAVGGGYYWRVIWGTNASVSNPQWQVDETLAPTATFTKQTQPSLGSAASGVLSSPPLFSWSDIAGAGQYQLQVSRDQQFADGTTASMNVFGLGTYWSPSQAAPLTSGTWYWRVRPIDLASNGLTYSSPSGSFVINPPAPTPSAPSNGATVVASPKLSWNPVDGACSYDVQVSDTTSFPDVAGSGGSIAGGDNTGQIAWVPTGENVTHSGTWYWHVRAELCDGDTGGWSNTESFASERPPQFNLNRIPTSVSYNTRIAVVGQLVANGAAVANPDIILERRLYPSDTYAPIGHVVADASGRFAFGLKMTRSADYQLRWSGALPFEKGIASFNVTVNPRVSFALNRSRVVRGRVVGATGFVYPVRPAWVQYYTSHGWSNLVRVPLRTRFAFNLRAGLAPGHQRLRLYSPTDANHTLASVGSTARGLFVYDVIVVKK